MGYHGLEKLYDEQRHQKKETIEDVYYYQEVNNPYAAHHTITVQKVRCPDRSEFVCVHCEDEEEGWSYIYLSKEEAKIMAENILKSLNNEKNTIKTMTKEDFLRLPINERIDKLYNICQNPRRNNIKEYIIKEDLLPQWVASYAEDEDRYYTLYFEMVLEHMSEELELMKEDGEDESDLIPNEDWDKWYDLVFVKKIYGFKIDW